MNYESISYFYPTFAEIETTSRCNINPPCPMCARAYRDISKEHDMPDSTVDHCSAVMSHVDILSIFGIGEPLLDPRFGSFVKNKKDGRLIFLSNGQIMTQKHINIILSRPVDLITFSLDAASPQTYHKIRGSDLHTFDKVVENIKSLVDQRNKKTLKLPIVKIAMVIMAENFHEIPSFIELAYSLGLNGVSVWPLDHEKVDRTFIRNGWTYNEKNQIQENIPTLHMKQIQMLCKKLSKKYNLSLEWRMR